MKNILITGGAGFIGTNFVHHAVRRKLYKNIVIVDALTYAGIKENISPLFSKSVRFIKGDISDSAFIMRLFKKARFDAVVNFAAETHVDRSIVDPAPFIRSNVLGTYTLLEACRAHKTHRFHQISTDEVYGDTDFSSRASFTELFPLHPSSPYSASKAASDMLVLAYASTYGLFATISRCSNNYGPYQFPEKLIPYFFHLAQQDKKVPLYGTGKNIRDWLYVEDHCEAVSLILERGKTGEIYNIGANNLCSNMEIARMILSFLGKPVSRIKFVTDRPGHDRRYALNAEKLRRELSWKPRVSFGEGLKKTFGWYSANEKWMRKAAKKA